MTSFTYSEEELLARYFRMYEKLGRPPSSQELDLDPEVPSYSTFRRRLGCKSHICDQLGLPLISPKLFNVFCRDCVHEPEECDYHPLECARDAGLYFQGTSSRLGR